MIYGLHSQVEPRVIKSHGSLSSGYNADVLRGHMNEKGIENARCVYHCMDLYADLFPQSFFHQGNPEFSCFTNAM